MINMLWIKLNWWKPNLVDWRVPVLALGEWELGSLQLAHCGGIDAGRVQKIVH
jgi:hypothetical protein